MIKMVKVKEDLTGRRFTRLVVTGRSLDKIKEGRKPIPMWYCHCDCGNDVVVAGGELKQGHTKSCGCLNRDNTISRNISNRLLNQYVEKDDYFIGYTKKGEEFYISKEDYELCKQYTWRMNPNGYIETHVNSKRIFQHRLIMGIHGENWINNNIDHINHVKHDNRRNNLRIVTSSQNTINQRVRRDNKTGVTGVYFRSEWNRYEVHITKDGYDHYLGLYKTFKEAVKVREEAEQKLFGEYVCVA